MSSGLSFLRRRVFSSVVSSGTPPRFATVDSLRSCVGTHLGWSDWVLIEQERVQAFADATDDQQYLHTDPIRAAAGPFGVPIAHGFLSLSLVVRFLNEVVGDVGGAATTINIGLNRVRFTAPVPVGSRLRAGYTLAALDEVGGGKASQATYAIEMWTEDAARPACIVESVIRYVHD
jgi:acyl dehydratase|tara:strand:- start:30 stop:557 length:528 start_codon:yes stop_codon:yes gene_type:complete